MATPPSPSKAWPLPPVRVRAFRARGPPNVANTVAAFADAPRSTGPAHFAREMLGQSTLLRRPNSESPCPLPDMPFARVRAGRLAELQGRARAILQRGPESLPERAFDQVLPVLVAAALPVGDV